MKNKFEIDDIINIKSVNLASFGLERESLRVKKDAKLTLTKHPSIFSDKLSNPLITTDFSESQVEMITPVFETIDETYDVLSYITDIVNTSIASDEYLWYNSLPSILPKPENIPLASYNDDEKSHQARIYREKLAKKYGTKKQMISGIHYNFSFSEEFIKELYELKNTNQSYQEFKNELYLKITRNYLRYSWFIIYLTGCSVAMHQSFIKELQNKLTKSNEEYYSDVATSLRNSAHGYRNLKRLYPRYNTLNNFISDIKDYIKEGTLSEAKELYTSIRLKAKDNLNLLNSLENDGIQYIEIRSIDINSFDKCGISKIDMKFLHLFMIYLLTLEETDYTNWQKEALDNEILVAENAFSTDLNILVNGEEVNMYEHMNQIINNLYNLNTKLDLDYDDVLDNIKARINNPDLTYSRRLLSLIKEEGYTKTIITLSKEYKKESETSINNVDEKLLKYKDVALPNK